MKRKIFTKLLARCIALALAASLLTVDAAAVVKAVYVWGVKSINDRASSDVRISMEDLEHDYSGYFQSDGLSEYFHKDQPASAKSNMTEALAWLIDNQIISRDKEVIVTDIGGYPSVRITKEDISGKLYNNVTRSDALMYIYKATFGPLTGRVIGVETPSIRVDNGVEKDLFTLMEENGYLEEMVILGRDEIFQSSVKGEGTQGIEIWMPHADYGGDATGGTAQQKIVSHLDTTGWRYTPQGDKVVSIFGDTNLFVSDVEITQIIDTSGESGDHGSGGVVTGAGQAAIDYDTDYKEIFYVPGADYWFYRTTDVIEMYLQSLESKGIIEFESTLRSELYNSTFSKYSSVDAQANPKNERPSWDGYVDPYLVNLRIGKHNRAENVAYSPVETILGKNYQLSYNGSNLTIRRAGEGLLSGNTGYFTTETMMRMDVYRYIYAMVSANEKKLTALEADIVNYKYGLQYGNGIPAEDLEAVKFLVAKGILNYDGSDELSGLYGPMTWAQLVPILYRVANPNARLDFSQIQLTDSEQAWKAQGFQPSSIEIFPSGSMSELTFTYSDDYIDSLAPNIDTDLPDITDQVETVSLRTTYSQSFTDSLVAGIRELFNIGKSEEPRAASLEVKYGAPDTNWGERVYYPEHRTSSIPFITYVDAAGEDVASLSFYTVSGMLTLNQQLYFDFLGAAHAYESDKGLATFKKKLQELDSQRSYITSTLADGYDAQNPKHILLVEYLQNIHFIALIETIPTLADNFIKALEEWYEEPQSDTTWQNERYAFYLNAVSMLHNMQISDSASLPTSIRYNNVSSTGAYNTSSTLGNIPCANILNSLAGEPVPGKGYFFIEFDYPTSTGELKSKKLQFNKLDGADTSVANQEQAAERLNAASIKVSSAVNITDLRNYSEKEMLQKEGTYYEIMYRRTGIWFEDDANITGDIANAFSNYTLGMYADPTNFDQGYVKWSDIASASGGAVVRQSELLLYNTKTNTYGYFSYDDDPSKTRAIIGSIVINGDSKYGVVKKVTENGVAEVYYHLNAVRQLLALSSETAVLGGQTSVPQSDQYILKYAKAYPVANASGLESSQVTAVTAAVHLDASHGDRDNGSNPYYKAGTTLNGNNFHYCNFISLSQSNKIANIIYRKFTYTPEASTVSVGSSTGVAYGVVIFRPADVEEIGSPAVGSSTSLQDLLDAPGQAPAGDQTLWNRNKQLCNDYANWIYGTRGVSYVNTGYLEPEVYLFIIGNRNTKEPPNAIYGELTAAERQAITMGQLGYMLGGVVASRDSAIDSDGKWYTSSHKSNASHYYVDDGFRAMLSGDRLYLNEYMFDNVRFVKDGGNARYLLTNSTQVVAPFSVGNNFRFFDSADGRDYGNPYAKVTAVSSDGTVTAQVGPFTGFPVRYNGTSSIVKSEMATSQTKFGDAQFGTKATTSGGDYGIDLWKQFMYDVRAKHLNNEWSDGAQGNIVEPAMFMSGDTSSSIRIVFDGTTIKVHEDASSTNAVNITKTISTSTSTSTFAEAYNLLKNDPQLSASRSVANRLNKVEAYFEIKFSAWHYSIQNGILQYNVNTGAAAFLSPELFTSLNDLLVDKMIDESNGAIPVNEIPAGSLLKIGDYYYQAVGTSTDNKSFVGYAPLFEYVEKPAVVHAAKGFINQMIYAGNQYINVTHWIDPFSMLKSGDGEPALDNVAKKTLVGDARQKLSVDFNGNTLIIDTGVEAQGAESALFTPVELFFQSGLLAYKSVPVEQIQSSPAAGDAPTEEEGETQEWGTDTYILCNHAASATSGALDEIPFLVDDVLNVALYAVTTDVVTAGYKVNDSAPGIREAIRTQFQKAFAGDLVTLARMLIFLVLIWLFIAAWMCYFMWLGNLIPILETIRYPSGDRGKKGIDLMQIVSFGTITLDTEFRLGRFLQYSFVLAILLCIVMVTG